MPLRNDRQSVVFTFSIVCRVSLGINVGFLVGININSRVVAGTDHKINQECVKQITT